MLVPQLLCHNLCCATLQGLSQMWGLVRVQASQLMCLCPQALAVAPTGQPLTGSCAQHLTHISQS